MKELTIQIGESDLYIHMGRRVELGNGHVLYEAVLTDAHGSRALYIDHDDILDVLADTFAPPGAAAEAPAAAPEPGPDPRRRS